MTSVLATSSAPGGAAHMEVMEQAPVTIAQAQRTELETAYEETVRAASALILAFHLDLATAAIALARRVRQATLAEAAAPELSSIAGTAADLAERARRNPGKAGAADLHAAAGRLDTLVAADTAAAFNSERELLAA